MDWNIGARNFIFTPDSNWTLIWHLLISICDKKPAEEAFCQACKDISIWTKYDSLTSICYEGIVHCKLQLVKVIIDSYFETRVLFIAICSFIVNVITLIAWIRWISTLGGACGKIFCQNTLCSFFLLDF